MAVMERALTAENAAPADRSSSVGRKNGGRE
jgi:hypothetical protein